VVKVDYEGVPYVFRVGWLWRNISKSWTGKSKFLKDAEKADLEATLRWIPPVVAKLRQRDA
jgi:hypothetical protein